MAHPNLAYVELLILYERWAGERLTLEMAVPKNRRAQRPNSVSAVPSVPSIDIWRYCRFLGVCPELCRACLVVWVGVYSVGLVLIIVDSCLLGKS